MLNSRDMARLLFPILQIQLNAIFILSAIVWFDWSSVGVAQNVRPCCPATTGVALNVLDMLQ